MWLVGGVLAPTSTQKISCIVAGCVIFCIDMVFEWMYDDMRETLRNNLNRE